MTDLEADDMEPRGATSGAHEAGDAAPDGVGADLMFEFALDAPAETVWRAIETPHLREMWLPGRPLTDAEHRGSGSGREVRFKMRDDESPHVETAVTFQVRDGADGGSVLRIVHEAPAVIRRGPAPANDRGGPLMWAA